MLFCISCATQPFSCLCRALVIGYIGLLQEGVSRVKQVLSVLKFLCLRDIQSLHEQREGTTLGVSTAKWTAAVHKVYMEKRCSTLVTRTVDRGGSYRQSSVVAE